MNQHTEILAGEKPNNCWNCGGRTSLLSGYKYFQCDSCGALTDKIIGLRQNFRLGDHFGFPVLPYCNFD